jgi:roadblock/LC7 domain-containing protein
MAAGIVSLAASAFNGNLLGGVSQVINSIRGKSPEDAAKLESLRVQYAAEFQAAAEKHDAEFRAAAQQIAAQQVAAQTDIDKIEASSSSLFKSGWRPFLGWTCGAGFAIHFVIGPMCEWISALAGHAVKFPPLDVQAMLTLITAMLGIAIPRTIEKLRGVA